MLEINVIVGYKEAHTSIPCTESLGRISLQVSILSRLDDFFFFLITFQKYYIRVFNHQRHFSIKQ